MRLLLSSAHGPAGQQAASRQGVHHHQPVHVAAQCSPPRRRPPCCCWPAPAAQGENKNPRGSSAPEGARLLAARGYWRARILLPAPLPHRTFHLLRTFPPFPLFQLLPTRTQDGHPAAPCQADGRRPAGRWGCCAPPAAGALEAAAQTLAPAASPPASRLPAPAIGPGQCRAVVAASGRRLTRSPTDADPAAREGGTALPLPHIPRPSGGTRRG